MPVILTGDRMQMGLKLSFPSLPTWGSHWIAHIGICSSLPIRFVFRGSTKLSQRNTFLILYFIYNNKIPCIQATNMHWALSLCSRSLRTEQWTKHTKWSINNSHTPYSGNEIRFIQGMKQFVKKMLLLSRVLNAMQKISMNTHTRQTVSEYNSWNFSGWNNSKVDPTRYTTSILS